MADLTGIDPSRVRELEGSENERFVRERPGSRSRLVQAMSTMPRGVPMSWMDDLYEHPPVWVTRGHGAYFFDVDDHSYLDMYVADMSAFCGHAPEPVVQAVSRLMSLGSQFLLPSEDAIPLTEHLRTRYGLPKWQFTLSATQANTEIIRLAREATGREVVLTFDGKYHGHLDPTLVILQDGAVEPEYDGLPGSITGQARVVAFNDIQAAERALAPGDVALVLTEPAMTNAGFILPEPGFHEALRRATRSAGALLALDETHTLVTSYRGLTRALGIEPDFLTLGKSIGGGVPLGAYGMTEAVADLLAAPEQFVDISGVATHEVATGGTLSANALSLAAGRAALTEVLTEEAFRRTATLGARMADGLRDAIGDRDLRWSVVQEGAHACYFFEPSPPRNGAESRAADEPALRALMRVFMANRGVWESGWWLGPTVSAAHTAEDVEQYLGVFRELLAAIT